MERTLNGLDEFVLGILGDDLTANSFLKTTEDNEITSQGKILNDDVENGTFDIAKTANLQSTLNLKAPILNPTFQGNVQGISKEMVGLNLIDNTSDLTKPISTDTQNALDLR